MTYHIRLTQVGDAETLAQFLLGLGYFARLATTPLEQLVVIVQQHLDLTLVDHSHSLYLAEAEASDLLGYVSVHWLPYLFLPGPEYVLC